MNEYLTQLIEDCGLQDLDRDQAEVLVLLGQIVGKLTFIRPESWSAEHVELLESLADDIKEMVK